MRMIKDQEEEEGQGLNMMPLIDIVFLLLVYFIVTMTFSPDEEWINSLLSKGGPGHVTLEKQEINISFFPAYIPRSHKPSEVQDWYEKTDVEAIECRMNGNSIILHKHAHHEEQVERIHAFILQELEKVEQHVATREQQDPIKVHCFRQLPWRYALAGYDAVRAYEMKKSGTESVLLARDFGFAPNEQRDARQYYLGNELLHLSKLK